MNNSKLLSRLMTFTTVAQKKSFTGAAKHLKVSKSAVSQQVTTLEAELGATLLNRTTRELSLTALGSKLLERCIVLQDQVSLLFNDLDEAGINPSGRFTVTFPNSLQSSIIIPAITQLLTEYPNLEPVMIADDRPLDLVEHNIDVAIHVGELPDSGYRALPIGSLVELFCATPLYLSKNGDVLSTEELTEQRWITAPWQKAKTRITDCRSDLKETILLKEFSRCNTLSAALDMALAHLGIVLLPDIIARPLINSGQLVHIVKNIQGPTWPVYSVHAYQNEKPVHMTRFHQIICRNFQSV